MSWFSWKISSESGQAGLGFAGVNNLRVSGHKDWPSLMVSPGVIQGLGRAAWRVKTS